MKVGWTSDKWKRAELIRVFLDANPEVYQRFERKALSIASRGWRHYSARTIIAVMRFESDMEANPDLGPQSFKINDAIIPTLAHDFMEDHPELPGFFEMREVAYVPRQGQRRLI